MCCISKQGGLDDYACPKCSSLHFSRVCSTKNILLVHLLAMRDPISVIFQDEILLAGEIPGNPFVYKTDVLQFGEGRSEHFFV